MAVLNNINISTMYCKVLWKVSIFAMQNKIQI